MNIIEIMPESIPSEVRSNIEKLWNQDIPRKIMICLSKEEQTTASRIKEIIGHSSSTLHENIRKLENADLIDAEMVYEGNKQKIIKSRIITVSKNPEQKRKFKKYFQGIWVNSEKSKTIINFLKENNNNYYTVEDIAAQTGIPVDDVELLLSNWDSFTTRALSDFFKDSPFEKKIMYKGKK